jgi:hypothetical protein
MSGKPDELLKEYGLTAENIKDKAIKAIRKKNKPLPDPGKGISSPGKYPNNEENLYQ